MRKRKGILAVSLIKIKLNYELGCFGVSTVFGSDFSDIIYRPTFTALFEDKGMELRNEKHNKFPPKITFPARMLALALCLNGNN